MEAVDEPRRTHMDSGGLRYATRARLMQMAVHLTPEKFRERCSIIRNLFTLRLFPPARQCVTKDVCPWNPTHQAVRRIQG